MSRFTEAVARMRGSLLAVEAGLKTVGAGAHKAADQLAEKVREFRGGHGDAQGDGGSHADEH
jgi:hypothetical protein